MATQIRVVPDLLRHWARRRPDAPFVKCTGEWITFAEMDRRSDRVAAGLAERGVRSGDRVAVLLANCDEFLEVIFACAKLGVIQVPLNTYLKGEFLRHQLVDCGATALIADAEGLSAALAIREQTAIADVFAVGQGDDGGPAGTPFSELRESPAEVPAVAVHQRDIAAIVYTSGTTGLPKGCMLSHGYLTLIPTAYVEAGWMQAEDRLCTPFPLFHISGQSIVLMSALYLGASVVVTPSFSAGTFMRQARAEGATMLFGIGAMAMAILARPVEDDEPRGFRMSSWIPMTPERQHEFEARFGTPVICEGYGQTECAPALLNAIDGLRKRGTAGRPVDYLDVALLDDDDRDVGVGEVGEIAIRPRIAEAMFSGYWANPAATLAASTNFWHHTGDYGRRDDDGFISFVDRKQDAMRRRGENVSSIELEKAILAHPQVAACAVHAIASEMSEDDIKACIVPVDGVAPAIDELFEFFTVSLPYFAVPSYVEFVDQLPTNALGRVMKHKLRERAITPATVKLSDLGLVVTKDRRRAT